ncbi:uncharacterized protein BYT42DRAFT_618043 [Radiomyces spectabilis]|uniref:uncharacterized protein n=1 Tax=Radiomyces spectabilis TaxID=64574 RepID=UPI0022212AEC|nr:uncharacterized protein BYT42DRAFT_618043 [Radiomyces spectabilis]KAI8367625.1 hypothetical protein BYT42DRAFT_618043 [Radiomyces spectabilis]
MQYFVIHTDDGTGHWRQKRCTSYHIQLMLSFIGVKHAHTQQVIDRLMTQTNWIPDDEQMNLAFLLTKIRQLLVDLHYAIPMSDLEMAWRIMNREESICILLGGTSGCGKSTLASLLAHRIGITTVLSTDHVRALLRGFDAEKSSQLLWASSYHAGETLGSSQEPLNILAGYEAQNDLLLDTLDKMISSFNERKECLVIEGVALSIENMRKLVQRHKNCIPVLIYISNKQKHAERFAIRAKYMTVAPRANKYIHYFDNIRLIQEYLCQQADEWMIPKINNTNVDRSLAILHTTMINVLSRMQTLKKSCLLEETSGKPQLLYEEFSKVYDLTWSSKKMLRKIRQNTGKSHNESNAVSINRSHSLPLPRPQTDDHGSPISSKRKSSVQRSKIPLSVTSKKGASGQKYLELSPSSSTPDSQRLYSNDLEHLDETAWGSLAS